MLASSPHPASRATRWTWYALFLLIGVIFAEGLSFSTPIIFVTGQGFGVFVIYGLHYLLILDYLVRRRAVTLRTLAVGGFIVGITTESLLTKVIWTPPWAADEDILRLAGVGVFEVGFIVMVWHAWMSMALPSAIALTAFGHAAILTPTQWRRLKRWLPAVVLFNCALNPHLAPLALVGLPLNTLGIIVLARLYLRQNARAPLPDITAMALTRRERRIVWGLLIGMYALLSPVWRTENLPGPGPFLVGMGLVTWSIWLLVALARKQAEQTPPPPASIDYDQYTAQGFLRYMRYFTLRAAPLGALMVLLGPISNGAAAITALILTLVGFITTLRLTWRVRHYLRPRAPARTVPA